MQVAVMGFGTVGSGVVELILKNKKSIEERCGQKSLDVKHILDIRDFSSHQLANLFTKDFNDILNDKDVEIVVETMGGLNPAFDFVSKCLEAGKSVVTSNKELVAAKGYELLELAKKNNVKFMIAQVLRFWPEYELLKDIFDTQKYGKLLSGTMTRLGCYPKWSWDGWMMDEKRSGLTPFDLHIHDLDFMVYAFGQPVTVQSSRSKRPEQDYISATYKFDDFFVTTEAAWYAAPLPFGAGFRFQFEEALVTYEDGRCMVYQNDDTILDLSAGESAGEGSINLPRTNAYANEIHYFAECVRTGKNPDRIKPSELETVINILNRI